MGEVLVLESIVEELKKPGEQYFLYGQTDFVDGYDLFFYVRDGGHPRGIEGLANVVVPVIQPVDEREDAINMGAWCKAHPETKYLCINTAPHKFYIPEAEGTLLKFESVQTYMMNNEVLSQMGLEEDVNERIKELKLLV